MTTTQLRNMVVKKISKIDDPKFLITINDIIESSKSKNDVYELNDFQKRKIKKSIDQLKKGLGIKHEKVFDDLSKWLKEK